LINELAASKKNYFFYLDPPYYKKGSQLYRNHYQHENHCEIASKLKNIVSPWIVTYDNCDEIKSIYKNFEMTEFSLRYSASQKEKIIAKELMFYNNLKLHSPPLLISKRKKNEHCKRNIN